MFRAVYTIIGIHTNSWPEDCVFSATNSQFKPESNRILINVNPSKLSTPGCTPSEGYIRAANPEGKATDDGLAFGVVLLGIETVDVGWSGFVSVVVGEVKLDVDARMSDDAVKKLNCDWSEGVGEERTVDNDVNVGKDELERPDGKLMTTELLELAFAVLLAEKEILDSLKEADAETDELAVALALRGNTK